MNKVGHTTDTTPFVRAAAATSLIGYLQAAKIDPAKILGQAGITMEATRDPYASISLSAFTELLERTASLVAIPHLGMKIGHELDPANWGAFGFLMMNAPTVWTCLTCLERFIPPWQSGTHVQTVRGDGIARIEYEIMNPAVRHRDQDAELSLSVLINHIRRATRGAVKPISISLVHAPLASRTAYERYLGVWPDFEAATNAVWFDEHDMEVPNEAADLRLYNVISRHLEDQAREIAHPPDIVASIEDHIRARLAGSAPGLNAVASTLGIGARTLQRRLIAAGTGYSDIVERVRREEAVRYLESTRAEVKQIAYSLGFADASAFIKAFKRWTGCAPGQYRDGLHTD